MTMVQDDSLESDEEDFQVTLEKNPLEHPVPQIYVPPIWTWRVKKGYAATLLDLLAVVCDLKHYRSFCIQHRVKIVTDHKALLGIMKKESNLRPN
jgi:hypothetical protein